MYEFNYKKRALFLNVFFQSIAAAYNLTNDSAIAQVAMSSNITASTLYPLFIEAK